MVTALGDSKTAGDSWQSLLIESLNVVCDNSSLLAEIAVGGTKWANWALDLPAVLASYSGTPTHVLVNLGANDVALAMVEATVKADIATVLDALNAKWPSAQVGVAHVWRRGYAAECTTLNGWIDAVIADGREAWTFPGPDETVWLEGGDDGATMTTDGVHYSTAGETENAAQWKTAMGF